jgi:hypothetical protein
VALSRRDAGALTVLGAVACLMFGFFGFAVAVLWITAVMPVCEAMRRCPGARSTRLGRPYFAITASRRNGNMGLFEDHPIRFALAWLQIIVGWGAFFALAGRLKRYR